ncbi:MAG: sugar phosphate isomerase/epimerase [Clostridiales bacterium]|nr:sugar phosphate isomerase/epimerase [Clostridiales bacterium]
MKPAISTRIYIQSFGRERYRSNVEVIEKLHELGFEVLDFNFNWGIAENIDFILRKDDWQQQIDLVANTAQRIGVSFSQAHLPFIKACCRQCDPSFRNSGYEEYFNECMRRAYIACGMLGVKYVTAHPITCIECNFEREATFDANRKYYDPYVELGIRNNVGTAFENMMPCLDASLPVRYCQHYDELIELVDSYNDPMVAVCWDTGHANGMMLDQPRAIRVLGKRIKNLHINDNHRCSRDEHLLPFMGSIDWYSLMAALAEAGYSGDMTLESHVGDDAVGSLQEDMIRLSRKSAEFLIDIFREAKGRKSVN